MTREDDRANFKKSVAANINAGGVQHTSPFSARRGMRRAVAFAQRCVHAAASTVRGSCVALRCTKKAADEAHGAAGGGGFACSPAGSASNT
jgi:hypothetical protein